MKTPDNTIATTLHMGSQKTKSKPCNFRTRTRRQFLYGYHNYEFLKNAFLSSNPNCTSAEYEQACCRFARLAGV